LYLNIFDHFLRACCAYAVLVLDGSHTDHAPMLYFNREALVRGTQKLVIKTTSENF